MRDQGSAAPTPAPDAPAAATPQSPQSPTLLPARGVDDPALVYQAYRAQRDVLEEQLESLQELRDELTAQVTQPGAPADASAGVLARIAELDKRIASVDRQMADADANIARTAAIPGATYEPEPPPRQGPPEEAFVLGGLLIVVVLLPLTIAYARRIWRRGATIIAPLPAVVGEQLNRLEQAVESIAIEVERLGEGQRFMARVLTERESPQALGQGAAEPVPVRAREAAREGARSRTE
jgi:hypothetical protein